MRKGQTGSTKQADGTDVSIYKSNDFLFGGADYDQDNLKAERSEKTSLVDKGASQENSGKNR